MRKLNLFLLVLSVVFIFTFSSCHKEGPSINIGSKGKENILDTSLIDLKGEVNFPGIYTIKVGSTLYDLIELAGGFTEFADVRNLNLTSILSENQMIVIPKIQIENGQINEEKTNLININTATLQQLCTLSGIGEAKALKIIEYRKINGRFTSIDDLKNVSGIGEELFQKVKDFICV